MVFIFESLVLLCHLSGLWHDATRRCIFCTVPLFIYVLILSDTSPFCIILRQDPMFLQHIPRIIFTFWHVCVFLNCDSRVGPSNVNKSLQNVM